DHHDHTSPSGCLTQPVTYRCISPGDGVHLLLVRWVSRDHSTAGAQPVTGLSHAALAFFLGGI
ncbi:hypothetical protein ACFPCS_02780, partial [Kocuria oceani]